METGSFCQSSYFSTLWDKCEQYLFNNYDYCFLNAMHEKNRIQGADTIIIGNSHAMNGIIEKELSNAGEAISFCISSQDIFYNFEHIKRVVREGKRPIRRCLFNLGYYSLYWDISRSETVKKIIPRVYMPLFGRQCVHHMEDAAPMNLLEVLELDEKLYSAGVVGPFIDYWATQTMMEQSSYYNDMVTREECNMLGVQKVDWMMLNHQQRLNYVEERVIKGHNRLMKYTETREENGIILRDIVDFLQENNIKPYFFITPYSKLYMETIEPKYRQDIFSALDELEVPVEFIDMNYYADIFNDEDFIDSDHLNLRGAHKATAVLNGYIQMAEGL